MIVNTAQGGGTYGTLPSQINNFYATIGNASVALSWSNPADSNFAGVMILRKVGGYSNSKSDGMKVYDGTGTAYTDAGLTNGTQYYYRAFAYNAKHEYQTQYCVTTMTPKQGYQLGTFPVGTKLKFGSIFGNPIVQTIANKSGNDITLITDRTIAKYVFDATELLNSNSDRRSHGNNRYTQSNIHQWLNSEAGAGLWYTAQHSADQAPDSTHTVGKTFYDTAAGFLNEFSTKEKNYLKTQTIIVNKSDVDGGGAETFNARVWLPSAAEVGIILGSYYKEEGSQLALFTDDNSRIAYITPDAAAHCGWPVGTDMYWLRTPRSDDSCSVNIVFTDGTSTAISANGDGNSGSVRSCCCLDSSILCSLTPDSDGCYTVL